MFVVVSCNFPLVFWYRIGFQVILFFPLLCHFSISFSFFTFSIPFLSLNVVNFLCFLCFSSLTLFFIYVLVSYFLIFITNYCSYAFQLCFCSFYIRLSSRLTLLCSIWFFLPLMPLTFPLSCPQLVPSFCLSFLPSVSLSTSFSPSVAWGKMGVMP